MAAQHDSRQELVCRDPHSGESNNPPLGAGQCLLQHANVNYAKTHKHKKYKYEPEDDEAEVLAELDSRKRDKSRKHKKHKHQQEDDEAEVLAELDSRKRDKSRKHKKHKHQQEDDEADVLSELESHRHENSRKHKKRQQQPDDPEAHALPEEPPKFFDELRTVEFPRVQARSIADALAPNLIFSHARGAFICNSSSHEGRGPHPGVRKMLKSMETSGIPMIAAFGTLLALIRDCQLATDDADFITFRRFLHKAGENKLASAMSLASSTSKTRKAAAREARSEYSYTLDGGKVDIFVAEEIQSPEKGLGYGTFLEAPTIEDTRVAMCFVPGVTEFAPFEFGDGEERMRFLVPKNAFLILEWMYGPDWRRPFDESHPGHKFHWWFSRKRFPEHCDISDTALLSADEVQQLILHPTKLVDWDESLAKALNSSQAM
eukprot:gnl/TRDRNA2_/TRDRNA2_61764_c0_seq1.p1 gnl/TRDRNA2_/TRDRNA2_61764_c0~~gnl/TRDRNA2_/TRDRNA2_61764_c0_seq1.p1  ORF type:complete len:459 (+),score=78.88 gnl/TRDRNA2_/TRDRNA2_61764_c0_seq1:84-1379(+)